MPLQTLKMDKDVRTLISVALAELSNSADWQDHYDDEELEIVERGRNKVLAQFRNHTTEAGV
jgi:hypothetical protein